MIKKWSRILFSSKKTSFGQIETFLLNAKDDNIKILAYKERKHIRYLYGNLFRNFVGFLDGGSLKNIIDTKNNDDEIKTSKPGNPQINDYIKSYTDYNSKSFENIFQLLITLFDVNNTSLQKNYEAMLITDKNKYKGVYLHEFKENSIGKYIYYTCKQLDKN